MGAVLKASDDLEDFRLFAKNVQAPEKESTKTSYATVITVADRHIDGEKIIVS